MVTFSQVVTLWVLFICLFVCLFALCTRSWPQLLTNQSQTWSAIYNLVWVEVDKFLAWSSRRFKSCDVISVFAFFDDNSKSFRRRDLRFPPLYSTLIATYYRSLARFGTIHIFSAMTSSKKLLRQKHNFFVCLLCTRYCSQLLTYQSQTWSAIYIYLSEEADWFWAWSSWRFKSYDVIFVFAFFDDNSKSFSRRDLRFAPLYSTLIVTYYRSMPVSATLIVFPQWRHKQSCCVKNLAFMQNITSNINKNQSLFPISFFFTDSDISDI